jgi:hypothetical protein
MKTRRKDYFFSGEHFRQFGWLKSDSKLLDLYNFYIKFCKVHCPFDEFEIHFKIHTIKLKPIIWFGTDGELAFSIIALMKGIAIPYQKATMLLICDHFCKSDGSKFNPRSLSTQVSRKKSFFVQKFVEELCKCIGIPMIDE